MVTLGFWVCGGSGPLADTYCTRSSCLGSSMHGCGPQAIGYKRTCQSAPDVASRVLQSLVHLP